MDLSILTKKFGIGITGGIATGKTTVAHVIESEGHLVIDADVLAREAVQPQSLCFAEIVKAFGSSVLLENGELNRKAMAAIIFASPEKRLQLEAIVHPQIRRLLEEKLSSLGVADHPGPWFYEAALLYETQRAKDFGRIWATHCDPSTQINRLRKRLQCTEESALKILESQMPSAEKAALADVVILTDGSLAQTRAAVLENLKELSRQY